ncbi:YdiK family protein [Bacillus aquiflavi]|uniref:YdiK family protein n=1 Tax=Bacillus aquiflavi TaxID=2672567 RepID=A0A6B3W0C2_9BACI|nr:YdiK family protein [Bacillus aquiflavi]MBA4538586.1 YdiK family protein [Bacillus aquiflavi]NEY82948.1 YdiK family protein [Bacillus aquiflavi]UAC48506.1 YdiK family protein [Bacillus aquiflavi]
MRASPLFTGFVYIFLGILFTFFAIQNVNQQGWGFFSYLLVLLATIDFGAGIRMTAFHFITKKKKNKSD